MKVKPDYNQNHVFLIDLILSAGLITLFLLMSGTLVGMFLNSREKENALIPVDTIFEKKTQICSHEGEFKTGKQVFKHVEDETKSFEFETYCPDLNAYHREGAETVFKVKEGSVYVFDIARKERIQMKAGDEGYFTLDSLVETVR